MTNKLKTVLRATLPLAIALASPTLVNAQATTAGGQGVAIADLDEAIGKSNAGVLATNQIQITYKANIDAAQARATALNTELGNLRAAIQNAQKAPTPNQAVIQQQVQAYQARETAAQQELGNLSRPFQLAQAYAREQIGAKLEQAARAAMTKKRVGLLLKPEASLLNAQGVDITNDVIAELNTLVPNVQIVPPANWQPGGAQGAPGAAAVPQPAAAPAAPAKPGKPGR
jgi:Skp family chaperone for outer membrane proteins